VKRRETKKGRVPHPCRVICDRVCPERSRRGGDFDFLFDISQTNDSSRKAKLSIASPARGHAILAFNTKKDAPRIRLYAVVIMPDHVHLLLSPRRNREGWPYPLVDIRRV
jgi:hypothetical protein